MSTVAQSAEPIDVLREAEPFSRDSLKEPEIVEALWQEAENVRGVNQTLFGVMEIVRERERSGNIHRYEVATALDYHGVASFHDKAQSAAFRERLRSQ